MKHAAAIAAREIAALFATPLGWVLLGLHLVFTGYVFFLTLQDFIMRVEQVQALQALDYLATLNLNDLVIAPSLGTFQFLFIVLIPVLTMRAFAEERANGTIELLLTSPVTPTELVLGKYLAVLAMVALMVALVGIYPALLFWYGNPEVGQTLAALLGLLLIGAALGALGCFTSTLTRSPALSALIGILAGLALLLASSAADRIPTATGLGSWFAELVRYIALWEHYEQPLAGAIRSEDLVYTGVFIAFFLALSRTTVESLRVR
jgi:ABC-2 type transport system permease protein